LIVGEFLPNSYNGSAFTLSSDINYLMSIPTNLGTQVPFTLFRLFRVYLKDFKFAFFIAVIGIIGYSAIDVAVISQLKPIIDDSLGKGDYEYLRLAAYFIVPLFILRGVFNFLGTYTVAWIGNHVVMRMRQQLFGRYIHLPVEFHDNNGTGQLISKVIYDTEQVSNAAGKALLTLVRDGALVVGLLLSMFYYSWQLSLIFILIGPLVAVIVSVVSKRFRLVSKNIPLKDLRRQFTLVSQHVVLFNGTIANNIAYGSGGRVSTDQIMAAAKTAHVLEFVEQLPEGLDTIVGENGFMLSGGQRQRLAVARALLLDAPILILDEATLALDTESERLIQDSSDKLQQNRTSIVVAHRLSTIENADTILVIEAGEIIEQGNHQNLLAQNGTYLQLCNMQFNEKSVAK
jgi:ABC-type multidrug transport system fused ATPase/permease subunit